MVAGAPAYAERWLTGRQHALLAGASGLYIAEPEVQFQRPVARGAALARIVDLYGQELSRVLAPVDGMVFGLRSLSTVQAGDWTRPYGLATDLVEPLLQELPETTKAIGRPAQQVLRAPSHPYTQALLAAVPRLEAHAP